MAPLCLSLAFEVCVGLVVSICVSVEEFNSNTMVKKDRWKPSKFSDIPDSRVSISHKVFPYRGVTNKTFRM